ncbi:hypothetical protein ACFYWX_09860 [Streptomyces sp. NPDC002888]|uniref:hypothetical protein n=1 Tax=Streptomyces sp. NPDC002888 TaxID=3364668 RepID=UPI00369BC599
MTTNTVPPQPPGAAAPPTATPELRAAGVQLAKLALRSPSVTGRAVLKRVADDAAAGGRALVGLDLVHVYPPHLLVPDAPLPNRQIMGWLGVARDVCVFAPIVVTWLSLFSALEQYEDGANFLTLWAHDFGGVAVLSVVALILVVVALTVSLHWLRLQAQKTSSRAELRRSVGEQLALITFELSTTTGAQAAAVPTGRLVRAAGEISGATDRLTWILREATERLGKIFDPGPESGFTKALEGWTASAGALERMGKSLTVPHQLIQEFAAMRKSLGADEEATRRALAVLLAELNEATETSRDSDQAHVRVAEVVLEGTRQVREAMERFVERTQLLDMYMEAMEGTLNRLDPNWADAPPSAGPTAAPSGLYDPMGDDGFDHLNEHDDGRTAPAAGRGWADARMTAEEPRPDPEPTAQPEPEPEPAPGPADPSTGFGPGERGSSDTDLWYGDDEGRR